MKKKEIRYPEAEEAAWFKFTCGTSPPPHTHTQRERERKSANSSEMLERSG